MGPAPDVLIDAIDDIVDLIRRIDGEDAGERILDVPVVSGDDDGAGLPEMFEGNLEGLGELRAQVGIAELQQFGVIVLGEDPEFRFARPVHAVVVMDRYPVDFIHVPGQPHIGVDLEIIVGVALVVVGVCGRKVIVDVGLLQSNARLDVVAFLLVHVVQVPGIDVLAPLRPVAQPGVDDRLVPSRDVVGDGYPAPLEPRPRLQPAAAQRLDVVDLHGERVLLGHEVGCVHSRAHRRDLVHEIRFVLPTPRVLDRDAVPVAGLLEPVLVVQVDVEEPRVLLFLPEPEAIQIAGVAVDERHLRLVDMGLEVENG